MAEKIKVNQVALENDAMTLSGASAYFQEVALIPADGKTTLTANKNGQEVFEQSQQIIASFGKTMEQDVANIRSIGASFQEYDSMMSQLWENGCRYQTISAAE